MVLISHRGNLNGKNTERENEPEYIDEAIKLGYDVEIDIWVEGNDIYLGHDYPQHKINYHWLVDRIDVLWIHCKNINAVIYLNCVKNGAFNYFWHQEDDVTLTSREFIWAYPGKQPIKDSIAVLPELNNDDISKCYGICSDFIENYTHG
jgi:hypothetical protein